MINDRSAFYSTSSFVVNGEQNLLYKRWHKNTFIFKSHYTVVQTNDRSMSVVKSASCRTRVGNVYMYIVAHSLVLTLTNCALTLKENVIR